MPRKGKEDQMGFGTCNCSARTSFANPIFGTANGNSAVWASCEYGHGAIGPAVPRKLYEIAKDMPGSLDGNVERLLRADIAKDDKRSGRREAFKTILLANRHTRAYQLALSAAMNGNLDALSDNQLADFAEMVGKP
jgi:hypothetical protein